MICVATTTSHAGVRNAGLPSRKKETGIAPSNLRKEDATWDEALKPF
jgi:hypothetical protein